MQCFCFWKHWTFQNIKSNKFKIFFFRKQWSFNIQSHKFVMFWLSKILNFLISDNSVIHNKNVLLWRRFVFVYELAELSESNKNNTLQCVNYYRSRIIEFGQSIKHSIQREYISELWHIYTYPFKEQHKNTIKND